MGVEYCLKCTLLNLLYFSAEEKSYCYSIPSGNFLIEVGWIICRFFFTLHGIKFRRLIRTPAFIGDVANMISEINLVIFFNSK